ncbi:hypothetical protein [Xenorhabdus ehlersii]|uniref:Uncharacterized protein n=1 Tax=Xenorhabdus ehlersii TaxID=290111 RepID=A0A2D0IMD4_9GAMM|nr:hypothetical protein [Xenorhabdus ehlersii]PHM22975.1 hypothetical protein Xehl_03209 [Xenorhabdus ehlersii]RKE92643.1 hypothetical protein BDE27_0299 [Xenorhabdus ehlersii]
MPKHIHADLISEYARLSHITDRPWEYFEHRKYNYETWKKCGQNLTFNSLNEYRIVTPTIKIGEYDVPEPEREAPKVGTMYWIPNIGYIKTEPCKYTFNYEWGEENCLIYEMAHLENGLVHLKRESAELHAKALISLTSK